MESVKIQRKRGRKRKRKDAEDEDRLDQLGTTRAVALVGRYLRKQFEGRNYIGKIVAYDSGLYRVEYEDGDCEDLDSGEAFRFLIGDAAFTKTLLNRKRKLDDMISRNAQANEKKLAEGVALSEDIQIDTATSEKHVEEEADSDMDSACESCKSQDPALGLEAEPDCVPPLELPPSSGSIEVPEEYVSHLFSVYSFLRSFSIRLFLSPFGLDDFVGALNCPAQNTLLDAIHVALLRVLRRHLETMSTDGSELASTCLRCIDWSLLDSLTWPVYVIRYIMVMGYTNKRDWKGFYGNALEREYYSLSASMKLIILQMLCDDVLNSVELRVEVDMREEVEGDYDEKIAVDHAESIPRRVHPKFSKTSACRDLGVMKIIADNHGTRSDSGSVDQDSNSDECRICGMDGTLLCCDGCPSAYHSRCIGVNKLLIPDGAWFCPECTVDKTGPIFSSKTSLKSAEVFGIDSDKRVFLGTCDHLLVIKAFTDKEPCLRYYNKNDIKRVAETLNISKLYDTMYFGVCKKILKYWEIPEDTFVPGEEVETEEPNQEGGFSFVAQRSLAVKSNIDDMASHSLSDNRSDNVPHANGLNIMVANPFQVRASCHGGVGIGLNERKECFYTGSNFNRNAYINHYMHGEFSASAAANLAVLSSEENKGLEAHASENVKKAMSANVLLQVKAFTSAATRFFWPNSEKKFVEVPRERCGWCLSCRGSITSKKACMLNAACLSAHRGAMKFLSILRASKNEDACLASIATYILYMEDSLSALMVGPFMSENYRRQWQKKVGHASTCSALKSYLLELERNIRDIALSSDWVKLVDDSYIESRAALNSSLTPAPAPKRGRRKKKLSSFDAAECEDRDDISWWRGGKLPKLIFQKGILPSQNLKRAAREGGMNKIPGIDYSADSGIPRRSRQFIWRAAVEMCKNTCQLALEVRTLDHHLRWSDLNRPEQISHEGKGSDTDASVFRNALICDKRIVGTKTSYGVVFENQKHLPLRVMKSVTDSEQGQDGREKHWFPEMRIPLYLIREFEAGNIEALSQTADIAIKTMSILQKKQLKDARRNTFSYLVCKRDNLSKCTCTACPLEVLLRDAVKCSDCQGYCHANCTISSNIPVTIGAGLFITCKQCYFMKPLTQGESSNSPTSPLLPFQGQGQGQGRSAVKSIKGTLPRSIDQPLTTVGIDKSHYTPRSSAVDTIFAKKKKKKTMSWGLLWKKKKTDDSRDFLRSSLLFRGTVCLESPKPACALCHKPYNPELTYIRCETCRQWYHGDAVELDESKIPELMGFKCCKGRRIRPLSCPYLGSDIRKPDVRGLHSVDSNVATSGFGPLETLVEEESSSPLYLNTDDIFMHSDDPLLFSLSRVEQVTEPCSENDLGWDISESGPKKLPVRRQVKNENDSDDMEPANQPVFYDAQMNGDVSNEAAQDGLMFDLDSLDYEDMEFEPHTYFSMTELFEDDGEIDASQAHENDYGLGPSSSMSNVGTGGIYEPSNNSGQQKIEPQEIQSLKIRQCDSCKSTVPSPDLLCDLCGLSIHTACSPWFETTPVVDVWRCGSCREWQ